VPTEDVSTQQAQQLAVLLNRFLATFVAGSRDEQYEQENHLREVIVQCATFGYLLFSQPSEYQFRYDCDNKQNGVVVWPGLRKISGEDGVRYDFPQSLVAPVIESI
jgi:hypothetical protein